MAKNIIGIDISDFSIELVALDKDRHNFIMQSYARFRLSPDIVQDGRILDVEKLKEAIKKLLANAKPSILVNDSKVFLSIPESNTYSRVIFLPKNLKEKDLKQAALNKAEERIPEERDKLVISTKILPNNDKYHQVFYTAVKKDILKSFIEVFHNLGLEIEGITTEAVSSFAGLKKQKLKGNTLLLDLGARTTIASIFDNNGIKSSINIAMGGEKINQALRDEFKISDQNAEKQKQGTNLDSKNVEVVIIKKQLQLIVDELELFFKYWKEYSEEDIQQLILIGGLSQMKGIDQYFSKNLNLEVNLGQAFLDTQSLPSNFSTSKYINALGLAKLAYQDNIINFYSNLSKKDKQIVTPPKEKEKIDKIERLKKIDFISLLKNIKVIIVLILIILGAIFLLFRKPILNLFQASPTNNMNAEARIITKNIIVSTELDTENPNFILGENYTLMIGKQFNSLDLDYEAALNALQLESDEEVLSQLNTLYQKDDYYIIPQILSTEIKEISSDIDNFIPGEDLSAKVQYNFLAFSKNSLIQMLTELPEFNGQIINLDFTILEYETDSEYFFFNLTLGIQY